MQQSSRRSTAPGTTCTTTELTPCRCGVEMRELRTSLTSSTSEPEGSTAWYTEACKRIKPEPAGGPLSAGSPVPQMSDGPRMSSEAWGEGPSHRLPWDTRGKTRRPRSTPLPLFHMSSAQTRSSPAEHKRASVRPGRSLGAGEHHKCYSLGVPPNEGHKQTAGPTLTLLSKMSSLRLRT